MRKEKKNVKRTNLQLNSAAPRILLTFLQKKLTDQPYELNLEKHKAYYAIEPMIYQFLEYCIELNQS